MTVHFGPFELNLEQYRLRAAGVPVEVQPKVLELLAYLVARRDRVVRKEELLDQIWGGAFVSDSAVSRSISEVRKAIERGGGDRAWITTVYGRGFRFVGPASEEAAPSDEDRPAASGAQDVQPISIAVLPFADLSPERDQAFFCEGISEEMLHRLSRLPELQVVARGVSFQFAAQSDPRKVGRELDVRFVLAGTVRKDEEELRVAAELIDTRSGFRTWSNQWHREPQEVLAVQDQIATQVSEALGVDLAQPRLERLSRARRSRSARAYEHYLRGRDYFKEGRRETYHEATRHYEAAIEIDAGYALAHAGLADCCSYLYQFHEPSESHRLRAGQASARAIELAPEVAETHAARALALVGLHREEEAEHHFRRALELDPASFEANYHFARHSFARGHFREALEHFRRAAEADPTAYAPCSLAASASVSLSDAQGAASWQARCLQRVKRRLLRNPDDQRAVYLGAVALAYQGQTDEALQWSRRAERLDPTDPVALYNLTCVASLCGDVALGFDYLEKAIAAGYPMRAWIEHDSDLDALRTDPRFAEIIDRLGKRQG